jgi:hypothetical protein
MQQWGCAENTAKIAKGENQIRQECTGKSVHSFFLRVQQDG